MQVPLVQTLSFIPDCAPGSHQPFHVPCCICRACGRQTDTGSSGYGFRVLLIHLFCRSAVDKDPPDRSILQNRAQIIGCHIPDAGIGGSFDPAGRDHIPGRNVISQKKCSSVRYRHRYRLFINCRHNLPETILRVTVEKHGFPRFDRGKAPKDQNSGTAVIDRRNRMNNKRASQLLLLLPACCRSI